MRSSSLWIEAKNKHRRHARVMTMIDEIRSILYRLAGRIDQGFYLTLPQFITEVGIFGPD